MRVTRWWGALGAIVFAACQGPQQGSQILPDSAAGPTIDVGSAPGQVTLALWQLRPDVALGEWAATRTGERLETYNREANRDYLGDWCARSATTIETGARSTERLAYFYPPAPPKGEQLPDDLASGDSLKAHCQLGLVATQIVVGDEAAGTRLNDSIVKNLDRAFGQGRPNAKVSFFGSAFWHDVVVWRRQDMTIVSAVSGLPYPTDETAARWTVVTFGFLPSSRLSIDPDREVADGVALVADTLPLAEIAKSVRRDSAPWLALRRVLVAAEPADAAAAPLDAVTAPPPAAPDSLIAALRRWLNPAPTLPPQKRAARLFVADQVLDRAACAYGLCSDKDSTRLAPLKALGAKFTWSDADGGWIYRRNWLYEARALDRDGKVGNAVLLIQLAQGFDPSGSCEGGGEGFQRVLDNGERYLARVPNTPIAAPVHFFLGEAYRDIVALADGAADANVDTTAFAGRAGMARREALRHYRAVIDLAPGTNAADLAWRRGWWLLSGLPMKGVRFLCSQD